MTVKELIAILEEVENKDLPVYYMTRSEARYSEYTVDYAYNRETPEIHVLDDGVEIQDS